MCFFWYCLSWQKYSANMAGPKSLFFSAALFVGDCHSISLLPTSRNSSNMHEMIWMSNLLKRKKLEGGRIRGRMITKFDSIYWAMVAVLNCGIKTFLSYLLEQDSSRGKYSVSNNRHSAISRKYLFVSKNSNTLGDTCTFGKYFWHKKYKAAI